VPKSHELPAACVKSGPPNFRKLPDGIRKDEDFYNKGCNRFKCERVLGLTLAVVEMTSVEAKQAGASAEIRKDLI
jgi:hypothetical protein